MELIKKQIHYNREGKRMFDQFVLDEDYNVPDAKEDVRQIIQSTGTVKVEDIRMVENYVKVTGKFYFQILYLTEAGEPRPDVLEGKLPFEEMVYAETDEAENYFIENIRTEFAASMVHSRKVSLKVMIEMEIWREKLEDEETTVDVESAVPVNEAGKSLKAPHDQAGYIPGERRNHPARHQGECRCTAGVFREQPQTGNPPGGGRSAVKRGIACILHVFVGGGED